ncbi:MAG: hypothetical protein GXP55_09410 [Deltaproteobacteria bacterium]|nr:hypothetical protein [Deltaproteobacteria bacterium]
MPDSPSTKLLETVLSLSGLSRVLGPGILRRSLIESGADPDEPTSDDVRNALPRIEARLRIYMPDSEAVRRAGRIAGFLAHADGELESEDPRDWSVFGKSVDILKEARRRLSQSQEIMLDDPLPEDHASGDD